ncbi:H(+)/Cl(-) exchange transporter 7-like isoform X2 [Macrosteles quadrilineatus]|uniref:H(+)/Cl(-) exchange transporter 7-like isoform X2 n=1 Tax=Macrosteles quadrilineatus TaxID=74068 RepID=UPI0023E113D6|nr:H(+)/Cl(-) exchange transporter 7-like isoform X2 [Macrosteles quadrilineatus]XP_054283052.1 H(+)/Cl(-) exchange transporter 7-like isoform X2 [Macrosteles quadrilineatus]XP_054283175.1 H(+)/Cl(-) exchange transporter 7-like isoform X2 [Macrosteles quadrilineatus]
MTTCNGSYEIINLNQNPSSSASTASSSRLRTVRAKSGSLSFISSKYESLDYDTCENKLLVDEERTRGYPYVIQTDVARWFLFFLIGLFTAAIGVFVDIAIAQIADYKYSYLRSVMNECVANQCFYKTYFVWLGLVMFPVMVASILVVYVEPAATGSGVPIVISYLNGVKMPHVVDVRVMLIRVCSTIATCVAGLAGGKEGPMIHTGAIVGGSLATLRVPGFSCADSVFHFFREDHEKRDFVAGGSAAGVAAAFGAPVGGVLLSLEEGTSFWSLSLIWKIFLSSMVATFTLNLSLSAFEGHPGGSIKYNMVNNNPDSFFQGQLTHPGLLFFGKLNDSITNYEVFELPIFIGMGAIGGVLGAVFVAINMRITTFRMKYIKVRYLKLCEAMLVAFLTASAGAASIYFLDDYCHEDTEESLKFAVQVFCPKGTYNELSSFWFQRAEDTLRSLFHDPKGSYNVVPLIVFFVLYFMMSVVTTGLSVSAGVFVPALLSGAAWGRLIGIGIQNCFPESAWAEPAKYAVIGAAAHLGGISRISISLTVMMIEATGNITFGLPLMLTLITTKWVGDLFTEGVYEMQIYLLGVPLLPSAPPPLSADIKATEVMSAPAVVFPAKVRVGRLIDILENVPHNGFPIVDSAHTSSQGVLKSVGRLKGLILRSQLIVLLRNKCFNETPPSTSDELRKKLRMFRDAYAQNQHVENDVKISEAEYDLMLDLRPYMNPSPYTVKYNASLPRIFRLFRGLGLRHIVVVNDINEVVGMVTRKDLARYRTWRHAGTMGLKELRVRV